jgi:hypothetical protein
MRCLYAQAHAVKLKALVDEAGNACRVSWCSPTACSGSWAKKSRSCASNAGVTVSQLCSLYLAAKGIPTAEPRTLKDYRQYVCDQVDSHGSGHWQTTSTRTGAAVDRDRRQGRLLERVGEGACVGVAPRLQVGSDWSKKDRCRCGRGRARSRATDAGNRRRAPDRLESIDESTPSSAARTVDPTGAIGSWPSWRKPAADYRPWSSVKPRGIEPLRRQSNGTIAGTKAG